MTAPPYLALFDCDGTLVDSQHSIVAGMAAAWQAVGWTPPPAAAVRRMVGLQLETAITRLVLTSKPRPIESEGTGREPMAVFRTDGEPAGRDAHAHTLTNPPPPPEQEHPALNLAPDLLGHLADVYRRTVQGRRTRGEDNDPLYPGIRETLLALDRAGVLLGVATGKSMRGLRHTLDRHDLGSLFVTLQTSDRAPGKPHPAMVERALADTGARPAAAVVIGDTVFDIGMARNAGVTAIGVSWGYHEPDELLAAGAACIIDDPHALADAILALLPGHPASPVLPSPASGPAPTDRQAGIPVSRGRG